MEPCIISNSSPNKHGYARVWVDGKLKYQHRHVYELSHNIQLTTEQVIRHRCHNTSCIEITHLVIGTQQDNVDDMFEADRNFGKLSDDAIKEIRWLAGQLSVSAIAGKFNVNPSTISRIINKRGRK